MPIPPDSMLPELINHIQRDGLNFQRDNDLIERGAIRLPDQMVSPVTVFGPPPILHNCRSVVVPIRQDISSEDWEVCTGTTSTPYMRDTTRAAWPLVGEVEDWNEHTTTYTTVEAGSINLEEMSLAIELFRVDWEELARIRADQERGFSFTCELPSLEAWNSFVGLSPPPPARKTLPPQGGQVREGWAHPEAYGDTAFDYTCIRAAKVECRLERAEMFNHRDRLGAAPL